MPRTRNIKRGKYGWKFVLQLVICGYVVFMIILQLKFNIFSPKSGLRYLSTFRSLVSDTITGAVLKTELSNFSYEFRWYTNISNSTVVSRFFEYFSEDYDILEHPVSDWISGRQSQCNGSFVAYGKTFAYLRDVLVDPLKCTGNKGGEQMASVMNQDENAEFLKLSKGFFTIITTCSSLKYYYFIRKSHLRDWMSKTVSDNSLFLRNPSDRVSKLTLAVQRFEYVNLYHTMTDWYNVFLMLMVFKEQPANVTILWVDGHPAGGLDHVWTALFPDVIRAAQLPERTVFRRMVWAIPGYFSMLLQHNLGKVPYLEEFRHFFLTSLSVNDTHVLDCQRLSILFLWRRNYVAHPRNPTGSIFRKIKNEAEILNTFKSMYPNYTINGFQPDLLPIQEQLQYVINTDILIGMHGAGLTLTMFLPKHGALIELYPKYSSLLNHFRVIANWRHLKYERFRNSNNSNEFPDYYTRIPPDLVHGMVHRVRKKMCDL